MPTLIVAPYEGVERGRLDADTPPSSFGHGIGHPLSAFDRSQGPLPAEDVGGPGGYREFLEAIADPSHERHRELKEGFADDFNPHVVDVDWLSEDVADLARR